MQPTVYTWTGQFVPMFDPGSWWEPESYSEELEPSPQSRIINSGAKFYGVILQDNRMHLHYTEDLISGEHNPRHCSRMPLLEMIAMLWELQILPPNVEVRAMPTRKELLAFIASFDPNSQEDLEAKGLPELQFIAHWLYSDIPICQMCDLVRQALAEKQLLLFSE